MDILSLYLTCWLTLLGAAAGSFFACTADRLAAGEGLPRGRSRCDHCGHLLGVPDLIPVFSYLLCRGRCRYCGSRIPFRCLAAELAGALLYAGLSLTFGLTLELVMWLILGSLLLLLSLIDWRMSILPDQLLLAAAVNRLLFVFLLKQPPVEALKAMTVGALSVSLPLLILSLVMDHLLKKDTLGGGDIKLLFVMGLYLSWMEMVLLLLVGCLLALIWAAFAARKGLQQSIPFGPFLSAGWLVVLLFGRTWIQWYEHLLR